MDYYKKELTKNDIKYLNIKYIQQMINLTKLRLDLEYKIC